MLTGVLVPIRQKTWLRRHVSVAGTAGVEDLVTRVGRVGGGERTCAERHGLTTFAIARAGPSL